MPTLETPILETGVTGAARVSWQHHNPRDLVTRLLTEHPNADDNALARHLRDAVLETDQEYLLPILLYYVRNTVHALRRAPRRPLPNRMRAAARRRVTERIRAEAARITLDLVMPNGKPLRDCTGADCAGLGGWCRRLADRLGPRQKVGNVLSEGDVRELYAAA